MSSYIKGMWKLHILKEKLLLSVMMKKMCLKSRWLWMYQQVSSTLPGCAGVQEVGFTWAPTTHGGAHVNSSMSASAWQLCASPSTETYSGTGISFMIKTVCSYKLNFVHLGCTVPHENLHNVARLDARFSTLSLLWPEQSPHCWKTQCHLECWSWVSVSDS